MEARKCLAHIALALQSGVYAMYGIENSDPSLDRMSACVPERYVDRAISHGHKSSGFSIYLGSVGFVLTVMNVAISGCIDKKSPIISE